jgi:ubiquitin-protein ligase
MNLRLKRLANDFQDLTAFLEGHPHISLLGTEGDPPEKYQVEYRLQGAEQKGGQVVPKDRHTAEIVLTLDYPSQEPICRMLTPAFHPNIDPHLICITDKWAAGESLVDVVVRIGRMLSYQIYNIKSPRNGEAAKWAAEHLADFPLDGADLAREAARPAAPPRPAARKAETPAAVPVTKGFSQAAPTAKPAPGPTTVKEPVPEEMEACPNCRQRVPAKSLKKCRNGHRVCPDCRVTCRTCGAELCLLCETNLCSVCRQIVCSQCLSFCHFHRQPVCREHAAVCAQCGVKGCSQCFVRCSLCGQSFCKAHFDQAHNSCLSCLNKKETKVMEDIAACPRCGKAVSRKGAKFCAACGQKLQAA